MEEEINEKQGEMIIFISSKGGVGKTVVSVNVAAALASKGCSTCILDGSFQFGDVNLALDIQPRLTISDLVQKEEDLEAAKISNYLYTHNCGLKVLSAPQKPELADLVTAKMIPGLCNNLLGEFKYLVVDLPTGISDINLNFIEMADYVFVVTDLELSALKNTKILIKTLRKLEMGDKIRVIVNRSNSETILTKASQVPDMLETNEVQYVAEDYKVVSKSLNIGIPFVISKRKDKITEDIMAITKKFDIETSYFKRRSSPRKKKGMLGFLSR